MDEKRWQSAIENALFWEIEYEKIPAGALALAVTIRPAIAKYNAGIRTDELLEELENIT